MSSMPIANRLRKRMHRTIALVQDILVIEVYNSFPVAIIHGGTAIWRCYGGNRFSEDLDVYLPHNAKRANARNFLSNLKRKGFTVDKWKTTGNSIYGKFSSLGVSVRYEALFKNIRDFTVKHFEMSDGTFIIVNTLSPEQMIEEKVLAYLARKKVRDLYDVFFLLRFVENVTEVKDYLDRLMEGFQRPEDERILKTLIISGSIPTVENMLKGMRTWAK